MVHDLPRDRMDRADIQSATADGDVLGGDDGSHEELRGNYPSGWGMPT